jgi:hypothetical protein
MDFKNTLEQLSAELEKIEGAGNDRPGQYPCPRRGVPQRQKLLPAPQSSSVAGPRSQLARILDAILGQHQEYPPARRQEYRPANGYASWSYAPDAVEIEALPVARQ